MRNQLVILISFFISFKSLALVNYSKNKKSSSTNVNREIMKRPMVKRQRTSMIFDLESETFTNKKSREKFDLYKVHFGSSLFRGMSFYLKTEFGNSSTEGETLSFGNSEIVTMIDWMGSRDQTSANLFVVAGIVFPGSDSGIGHDRNDQILGLVTQKSFGMLSASASFSHYFIGDSEKTTLSSYDKAEIKLNYAFSPLVKFGIDVGFISTTGLIASGENQSFTEYSPYLHVGLGQSSNLKLGAKYASKNSSSGDFKNFNQWDLGSFTGNSIYASLGFSL